MENAKDSAAAAERPRGWRDALASVVFHGLELACLALILDRLPLVSAAFGEQGAAPRTPSSELLFDVCGFVNAHRGLVAMLLAAFLIIDAVIMVRLWHASRPWAAKLWFTAIGGVPVLILGAILIALGGPFAEMLTR